MNDRSSFRVNNFDLLRLFAALQVVVFHTASRFDLPLGDFATIINAFPGVPIFFVISGFLISASLERSKSLTKYARNRLLRILPALWVCIGLTAVIAMGFGFDLLNLKGIAWFGAQLFGLIYTPAALAEFGFGSYNGALWTIPVELQFYAVLPVLYWVLTKGRGRTTGIFVVMIVFTSIALFNQFWIEQIDLSAGEPKLVKLLRYSFVPHIYLFLVGVCLQRVRAEQMSIFKDRGFYWLAFYLLCVFLLPDSFASHVAKLVLLALVSVSMAYTGAGIANKLLNGNDISYGVYVYHGLVHNVFFQIGFTETWQEGLIAIFVTIAAGVASWIFVERPFIRKKTRQPRPERSVAVTARV